MMWSLFLLFIHIEYGYARMWPKGVVHYAINKKDYDLHSQEIIMSTFDQLEKELCVKFFNTPMNYTASVNAKILYISNPEKKKTCSPEIYDYKRSLVDMAIGYKCITKKDIARMVMDMLRASIVPMQDLNSYDSNRNFQEQEDETSSTNLLSRADRNYINSYYHNECEGLVQRQPGGTRRNNRGTLTVSPENMLYYNDKLWPLGIVMYGVEDGLETTPEYNILIFAMRTIELSGCVVFQEFQKNGELLPKNGIWFTADGEEYPHLGFMEGNQTAKLTSMAYGAPGHTAHTINMLMRAMGIPMMSNRVDRDNFVTINWKKVQRTKEHLLEKTPSEALLRSSEGEVAAYDYDSATHAPVNFMCRDCSLGAQTVQPVQDHLWQRSLTLGHRKDLSPADKETINLLYASQCQERSIKTAK